MLNYRFKGIRRIDLAVMSLWFLTQVIFAGMDISISGGVWEIGDISPGQTAFTTGNKWAIHGPTSGMEDIDVKVSCTGSLSADSGGYSGVNKFVLRENNPTGVILSSADIRLATRLSYKNTYYLDLWFKAPEGGSETGSHTFTVTLTAKNWDPYYADAGEWVIIDSDLVIEGQADGTYLMWARPKIGIGTNYNNGLRWGEEAAWGQPIWNESTDSYNWPVGGRGRDKYPAFKWAEDVVYKGFDDWRLPTDAELNRLWNYGRAYSDWAGDEFYWSSTEMDWENAKVVTTDHGLRYRWKKAMTGRVRCVRKGP